MCGVNGIFAYNTPAPNPSEAEVLATRDAMAKRGPDAAGLWWSKNRRCCLGHRRLAILDLSTAGAQPMISADGRFAVSFNGEIYNYPELRKTLETQRITFRSQCDTEALLHLYALYGPSMVHRLRGMFAIAIWDDFRRELFIARDPYGIKPLYYANDGWTFRFASQVKALLAGGKISRDIEPAGLVGFHLWGHVPDPFTLYREIRALPAGHTMIVDDLGPTEPKSFYSLAAVLAQGAVNHPKSAEEKRAVLAAGLTESVRAHLLADVEIGVFLSAGVDSSVVLGLARDATIGPLRAITLGFEEFGGSNDDEVPLATKVASKYGAEHVIRRVAYREFEDDLPNILDAMDQPSIDGVNTWFVSKAARELGLKVALSGLGGDELLGGYTSFRELPRWRRWLRVPGAIPRLGEVVRRAILAMQPGFVQRSPKAAGLLEYGGSWAGAYLLRRGLFMPYELSSYLDPELVDDGLSRLKPLERVSRTLSPDPGSDAGRVSALESSHYMRDQLLRDCDWAGMAHSLEIRVPLVDIELGKAAARLMPTLAPGEGKRLVASAPSKALPSAVVDRPKSGFSVPTGEWVKARSNDESAHATRGASSRAWALRLLTEAQRGGSAQPVTV